MRPAISTATLAALTFALASTACHQERVPEGPAQKGGEKVDKAVKETKDAAKDTKNDVKKDVEK